MTQFTGKSNYFIEPSRQVRVRTNNENAHGNVWEVSYPGQQVPDQVTTGSQSTRIVPSHKPSHQAFLNWVAYNRSLAPNIPEIVRRTCPLLDCEICFDSWEKMLDHVKECPRLSKGLYRCFESGKEERIGRCETHRCLDLQRCKDRIAKSIKRHLSPRGSGPRRQDNLPLEEQSLSPEADLTFHEMWPASPAELPCLGAVRPPPYSPNYVSSVPNTPAELGSGGYSAMQLTAPLRYEFAELDSEAGPSQSSRYLIPSRPELAELGANDDGTYTAQHFEHNGYGAAELNADNGLAYTANHQESTYPQQPHYSSLNIFNPQEMHSDWHQDISMSNSPLSMDHYDSSHLTHEQFQPINSFTTNLNETKPQIPPYGYPVKSYLSSTGSGASTDDSWGSAGLSTISTLSSRDTSMSSLEPRVAKIENSKVPGNYFLDEPTNRLFSEPDEMEPEYSPSTNLRDRFHNVSGIWDTCSDDAFVKGVKPVPILYPINIPRHAKIQPYGQVQKPGNNVSPSSPGTEQPPSPFRPKIKTSPLIQPPARKSSRSTQLSTTAPYECNFYCGYLTADKSNVKRHERSCEKNPTKEGKSYICHFQDCGKGYTRSDGLRVHQKGKGHLGQFDIFY